MFKDRIFNFSILFSCVWHLFWISAIGIVVTPSVQPSEYYQEVDFLGPILEKTAFDLMVERAIPQAETLYARSTLFIDNVYLKPQGPKRKVLEDFLPEENVDRFAFILNDYIKNEKESPRYFEEHLKLAYKSPKKEFPILLEGSAKGREIMFMPEPLTVPRGLYDDSEEYAIKLKFLISTNGIVYEVEPIVSSGYPEIDLQAIRFLKKWRFSPISVVEKDKAAWGIVTIKVTAK